MATKQTDFTPERAKEIREAVEDMWGGLPKSKKAGYLGHLNDILLFIGAAEKAMSEASASKDAHAQS